MISFSATDSSTCTTSKYLSFLGTTCQRNMTSHVSSISLQPSPRFQFLHIYLSSFPNLQHSKPTTYTSKRPITRRSAPGSPSQIRSMPRTKHTSSHPPTPLHPPTNSSAPPCATTRQSYSYTGTAEPGCCRLVSSITKPSRPVYARTSSRPTTAALPTRRAHRAWPG